jgi:hypothetical protein
MARNTVRGTPYTHIKAGNSQGMAPGTPAGYTGTQGKLYGRDVIDTRPIGGTPYHSEAGNGPETRRVVSQDKYGKVESNQQGDANDPTNNGSGVILDGANSYERGFAPSDHPTMDSPVPRNAPTFDEGSILKEDLAHLGRGNERGREDLVRAGGVMSRGMVQKSTSSGPEDELTTDDTLPSVGPAR